jgi:hypothetical protein
MVIYLVGHHQLVMVLINVHDSHMIIHEENLAHMNVHDSKMVIH